MNNFISLQLSVFVTCACLILLVLTFGSIKLKLMNASGVSAGPWRCWNLIQVSHVGVGVSSPAGTPARSGVHTGTARYLATFDGRTTVKSLNFVGMIFRGLKTLDMLVNT